MASAPKKTATAVAAAINGSLLTLTFSNGEALTVNASTLSDGIREAAIMHGLKQKLVDAAAIGRDPDTGRTATIDDKFAAVREVFDRITGPAPTWNKVRVDGESTAAGKGGLLVRAMMRLTSKSREFILDTLDKKTKEEVAALRKNPRIVEIIAQLQSEQANTNGIDSDALLDGLMDGSAMAASGDEGDDEPEADDTASDDEPEQEPVDEPVPTTAPSKAKRTGDRRAATATV